MQQIFATAYGAFRANRRRIFEYGLLGMFVALALPHQALADWSSLVTQVQSFKTAIVTISASLIVIGLVAAGVGWMTRSHEGLGPVFWGGVTMVVIGAIILMGDAFVSTLQGS